MNKPKSNQNPNGSVQCENTTLHLLKANDFVAQAIRKTLKNQLVINLCSSPGSGKTSLLQATSALLNKGIKIAVLVGDPETERDAVRMKDVGINALQIVTGGVCHIEAQMVLQALDHIDFADADILFIENVGNLLCPAAFDLGEDFRVTLIACTEGDDKPKKYPRMFLTSELMLVTKSDLLPYVPFSIDAVTKDAKEINKDLDVISISSLKGDGMKQWCAWLEKKLAEKSCKPNNAKFLQCE